MTAHYLHQRPLVSQERQQRPRPGSHRSLPSQLQFQKPLLRLDPRHNYSLILASREDTVPKMTRPPTLKLSVKLLMALTPSGVPLETPKQL